MKLQGQNEMTSNYTKLDEEKNVKLHKKNYEITRNHRKPNEIT